MIFGIIYKVINKADKKIYIGQTTKTLELRKKQHAYRAKKGDRRTAFQIALLKYGFDNFKWKQIDSAETQNELDEKEKYWIIYYKSNDFNYGYNLTDGGLNPKLSIDTKLKISISCKGQKRTIKTRQKMSINRKGKKFTEEHKRKISETHKGIIHTEKHCAKIKKASRNNSPLTEDDVKEIKIILSKRVHGTMAKLARKYNVSHSCILQIKNGIRWA